MVLNEEAVMKHGKLRTYALFKSNFQKEVYLETVKYVQKRKCPTQFRVSAHRLEIESVRYKKKTVSERICKFCNLNTVEDKVHFLCNNCSPYHNERQLYFKYIVDSAPSFRTLDDSAKLIWIMTCEDDIVINALTDFVYKCFEMSKCAIT